jgi:hypothetical protein
VYAVITGAPVLASVLPTVLFVGMMMAAVVGVMSLVSRRDPYDDIERGELSKGRRRRASGQAATDGRSPDDEPADPSSRRAERELEIRQMLEARSARLVRAGGAPLDVDAEMAKLLAGERAAEGGSESHGDQSTAQSTASEQAERELEIRQMLEARSARLVRAGGAPLDVDAEMARLLGGSQSAAEAASAGDDRAGAGAG